MGFKGAIRGLIADSASAFVEMSPHPVLSMALQETIRGERQGPRCDRGDRVAQARPGSMERFLVSLAHAHVHGIALDWRALFDRSGAGPVELPTYAFQRERYWIEGGAGDAARLGLSLTKSILCLVPPWIWRAATRASSSLVVSGLRSHPWLADHAVMGRALLPGAAFVELALAAAEEVGAEAVEELTLQVPLLFEEDGACQIQLSVGRPDEAGHREFSIYSRLDADGEWVLHAEGVLGEGTFAGDNLMFAGELWPPEDAQELDTEGFSDRLAEAGYDYGSCFQGLRRAYRVGQEIFAEVSLTQNETERAGSFGVHPALLDAALHTLALNDPEPEAPVWRTAGPLLVLRSAPLRTGRQFDTRAGQHGSGRSEPRACSRLTRTARR